MRKILLFVIFFISFSCMYSQTENHVAEKDSTKEIKPKNSTLALALSAAIPGAGQIYNGKYYKVPLIYGALYTSYYFARKANWAYQAYRSDILLLQDTNRTGGRPVTGITDLNVLDTRYNTFRRKRDLMVMVTAGIWIFNIIDAYIDAELSNFDVSDDLSLKIYPSVNAFASNQPDFYLTFQFNFK